MTMQQCRLDGLAGDAEPSARVLLVDGDRELLCRATAALHAAGCEVMIEAAPAEALALLRLWHPRVVVIASSAMERWDRLLSSGDETFLDGRRVVVTIDADQEVALWSRWLSRGHEILVKPLLHPSELITLIEQAA